MEMGRNPHGFIYSGDIDTYREKKSERIARQQAEFDHDEHR